MADEPEKTPIQNKYAQQYADDLAANRTEQRDITAQIAALQERLEQLRVEESWLAQAQSSLPGAAALGEGAAEVLSQARDEQPQTPAAAEAVADAPPSVPQPRQDESVKAEQPKQPAKKAPAAKKTARKKTTTRKTTAKKTSAATKASAVKKAAAEQAPAPEAAATQGVGEEGRGTGENGAAAVAARPGHPAEDPRPAVHGP
ncbi:hypothetical protein ACFYOV_31805 [Streptomyces sp. NPDC005931]|uniref:hypothetical protein n=1 Tax=Streptomyces sp. NPDC005931 TaxID=3364737 RepID=UPI0036BD1080